MFNMFKKSPSFKDLCTSESVPKIESVLHSAEITSSPLSGMRRGSKGSNYSSTAFTHGPSHFTFNSRGGAGRAVPDSCSDFCV